MPSIGAVYWNGSNEAMPILQVQPDNHRLLGSNQLRRMPHLVGGDGSSTVRRPCQSGGRLEYRDAAERYCGIRER